MALKDTWADKINGEDIVDADDINSIAQAVISLEDGAGGADLSDDLPLMDGEAAAGVSESAARADHVHPTDTSRMPDINQMGIKTSFVNGDRFPVYDNASKEMKGVFYSSLLNSIKNSMGDVIADSTVHAARCLYDAATGYYAFLPELTEDATLALVGDITEALTEAKDSGEFDGKDGADGKDGEDGTKWHIGIETFSANEAEIWDIEDFHLLTPSVSTLLTGMGDSYTISLDGFAENESRSESRCLRFSGGLDKGYMSFSAIPGRHDYNAEIKNAGGCTILFDLLIESENSSSGGIRPNISIFAGGSSYNIVRYNIEKKRFEIGESTYWITNMQESHFTIKASYPYELELDKWYEVGVEFEGASAAVYVNGKKLFASPFSLLNLNYIIFYPQYCDIRMDNLRLCGKDYNAGDRRGTVIEGQKPGDLYLNMDTGDVYKLLSTEVWANTGAKLIGPQGKTGATGATGSPGYTPQKYVDYFTPSDQQEIVNAVLNSLPTWTGGSY